jgi:hypothetical protein
VEPPFSELQFFDDSLDGSSRAFDLIGGFQLVTEIFSCKIRHRHLAVNDKVNEFLIECDQRTAAPKGAQKADVASRHELPFQPIKIFSGKAKLPASLGDRSMINTSNPEHFISDLREVKRVKKLMCLKQGMSDTFRLWVDKALLLEEFDFCIFTHGSPPDRLVAKIADRVLAVNYI